ncbi:MAG: radical SAM protein [Candidatus Magnetoovum sp. WYHC-5]|nr:radical SAM protein [Candidatus Magnetoovum sp. WYHC-5]
MVNRLRMGLIRAVPPFLRKDVYNALCSLTNYKLTPRPRHLHFELTYRCSCRCVFCSRWQIGPENAHNELTTEEIKEAISDAINLGVIGISFSGGEPFIREDFLEIAEFCKDKGLRVHVNSNGTCIDKTNAEYVNKIFDSVLLSVDSMDETIHDTFRGVKGTFKKAIKALELIDRKKTVVQLVINSKNIDQLYDYVKFMATKTDKIRLQPIHSNPDNLLNLRDLYIDDFKNSVTLESKWNNFIKKLKESGLKLHGSEKFYSLFPAFLTDPLLLKGKIDCFMGSFGFFIEPYGNVVPCEGIRKPYGNIKEEKLANIWKTANAFRRNYHNKKRPCVCMYGCLDNDINFWDKFFSIKPIYEFYPK